MYIKPFSTHTPYSQKQPGWEDKIRDREKKVLIFIGRFRKTDIIWNVQHVSENWYHYII